jgi:hypothetical protein
MRRNGAQRSFAYGNAIPDIYCVGHGARPKSDEGPDGCLHRGEGFLIGTLGQLHRAPDAWLTIPDAPSSCGCRPTCSTVRAQVSLMGAPFRSRGVPQGFARCEFLTSHLPTAADFETLPLAYTPPSPLNGTPGTVGGGGGWSLTKKVPKVNIRTLKQRSNVPLRPGGCVAVNDRDEAS